MNSNHSLLIADPDGDFLHAMLRGASKGANPLLVARNGKEAQLILADRAKPLAGVFVSPKVNDPIWLSVVRTSQTCRPATPVYLFKGDGSSVYDLHHVDLSKLRIRDAIERPAQYSELVKLVAPIALRFDAEVALSKARTAEDVGTEVTGEDGEYLPIRATDFLSGTQSFFDVFVRLNSTRFVKLLRAGDAFTADRLAGYLEKGISHFYIRKDVQESYLAYCDHITTALVKLNAAPIEVKTTQTLNQGEEVLKHLQAHGVTDTGLRYAASFSENVRGMASQMKLQKLDVFQRFMDTVGLYDHGVGTAMLAGLLAQQLQIASEDPVRIIGMSALLHDVALAAMPAPTWQEDESAMNEEERALFRTHPARAVEILSKAPGFHSASLQAIEQHHMRLGNTGFPRRTAATPVLRISEIIGICDEFNALIRRSQVNLGIDVMGEMEKRVFSQFSRIVVQAFNQVFRVREGMR